MSRGYLSEFDAIDVDGSKVREAVRVGEFLPGEEILSFVCDVSETNRFKVVAMFGELEELFESRHVIVHVVQVEFAHGTHVDTTDEIIHELIRLIDDLRREEGRLL